MPKIFGDYLIMNQDSVLGGRGKNFFLIQKLDAFCDMYNLIMLETLRA